MAEKSIRERIQSLLSACKAIRGRIRDAGLRRYADGLDGALAEGDAIRSARQAYLWLLQTQKYEAEKLGKELLAAVRTLMCDFGHAQRDPAFAPTSTLDGEYRSASRRFKRLRDDAMARATTWRWAKGVAFSYEPYHCERHGGVPGRWLKAAPTKTAAEHARYGFDNSGRVCAVISSMTSELFEMTDGHVDSYLFASDGRMIAVRRHTYEGARVAVFESYSPTARTRTQFEYEDGVLRRSMEQAWQANQGCFETELELVHDEQGLRSVFCLNRFTGERIPEWERPLKGETLKAVLESLYPHLIAYIGAELKRSHLQGQVFAVALTTEAEASLWFPPGVAVGLKEKRGAMKDPWDPESYDQSLSTSVLAAEVEALCVRANALAGRAGERGAGAVTKMLEEIAREVLDDAAALPVERSDDFVVFVHDAEAGSGKESVRKLAPPKLRARLEQRGML